MDEIDIEEKTWGYRLVLHRPPVNAMNEALTRAMIAALTQLTEEGPPLVVITGHGSVFSGGADMKEHHASAEAVQLRLRLRLRLGELLRAAPFPTIAAVNGACRGGAMNLIASCDIRLAHEHATFGLPEVRRGRAGGSSLLRGLIPEGTVRWLALTGETMDANDALTNGLVARVIGGESWADEIDQIATSMAESGKAALYAVKESLVRSREARLSDAQWVEQQVTFRLWSAGEHETWET